MKLKEAYDAFKANPNMSFKEFRTQFAPISSAPDSAAKTYSTSVCASIYKNIRLTSSQIVRNLLYQRAGSDISTTRKLDRIFGNSPDNYKENTNALEAMKSHLKSSISRINKDFNIDRMENMTDKEFVAMAPLFARYALIAQLADEIKAELPEDEQLNNYLEEIRNSPSIKYITTRLNIITSPLYAKHYNRDSQGDYSSADAFDTEKNSTLIRSNFDQDTKELYSEFAENHRIFHATVSEHYQNVIDLPQNEQQMPQSFPPAELFNDAENSEFSFFPSTDKEKDQQAYADIKEKVTERLKGVGKTQEQIDAMTFYDHNGKKLGNIDELAYAMLDMDYKMSHFFVHTEGNPIEFFSNPFAVKDAPKMPGDPLGNILWSGIESFLSAKNALENSESNPVENDRAGIQQAYSVIMNTFNDYLSGAIKGKPDMANYDKFISDLNAKVQSYLAFEQSYSDKNAPEDAPLISEELGIKDFDPGITAQVSLILNIQQHIAEKQDIIRAISEKGIEAANLERYKARFLKEKYTNDEINNLKFYNANGYLIGNINEFVATITGNHDQNYVFACLPGKDSHICNISHDPSFTLNTTEHYHAALSMHEPELPIKVRNAHIPGGSDQYAHMEQLFNEYNLLTSSKNFDIERAAQLIGQLETAATAYLDFKESQRGKGKDQRVHGKNAREQRRIDLAYDILSFAASKQDFATDTLSFQRLSTFKESFPNFSVEELSNVELAAFANTYTSNKQEINSALAKNNGKMPFSADRYPATDPTGKRSELDFEAAARIANIRAFAAIRPAVRPIVDAILNDNAFKTLLDNAVNASEKFNPLSAIISGIPEGEDKARLQAVYDKLTANDKDISAFRDHLTMLEYAAGVRRGRMPENNASMLSQYASANGKTIPPELNNGNTGANIVPTFTGPIIANFQNLEACLNARDLITLEEKNDAITKYLAETTNRVLDPLFGHLDPDFNRYNYVIVDGKSVHERILDRYFEMKANGSLTERTKIGNFNRAYRDKLAAEMIGTALMAGKSVQVYVPDGLGIVGDKPVDIKKTGYVPSKEDSDIINYFNEAGKAMGFKKKDPDLAARNERAFKIVQAKSLHDSALLLAPGHQKHIYNALWNEEVPRHTNYTVGRSMVQSLSIAMLVKAGHSLRDVADTTKLIKEKQEMGLYVLNLLKEKNIDAIHRLLFECTPVISQKVCEELDKLDYTNPDVLMAPENRHLMAYYVVLKDLAQDLDKYKDKTYELIQESFPDKRNPDEVEAFATEYMANANSLSYFLDTIIKNAEAQSELLDGLLSSPIHYNLANMKTFYHSLELMKNAKNNNSDIKSIVDLADPNTAYIGYQFFNYLEDVPLTGLMSHQENVDFIRGLGIMELDGKITNQMNIQLEVTAKGTIDDSKDIILTSNINFDEVAAANQNSLKAPTKSESKHAENNLEHVGRPSQQGRNIDHPSVVITK